MSALQSPLGTPFSAASTADDVLAGLDLTGRDAVATVFGRRLASADLPSPSG